jgi:hypothetical protein
MMHIIYRDYRQLVYNQFRSQWVMRKNYLSWPPNVGVRHRLFHIVTAKTPNLDDTVGRGRHQCVARWAPRQAHYDKIVAEHPAQNRDKVGGLRVPDPDAVIGRRRCNLQQLFF